MNSRQTEFEGGAADSDPARLASAHMPDVAVRLLSALNLEHGFSFSAEFSARKRSLAQIYETIQRYLTGAHRRSEAYYPSGDDVFEDLQIHKRTISDRAPMPSRADLEKELLLLALQSPPFIHVLRELACDPSGRLQVITRYSAPTEKHPDKVQVSFQAVARASAEAFKLFARQNAAELPWERELVRGSGGDHVDLRPGRIDRLLRMLFVAATPLLGTDAVAALGRLNQDIQRRIILPCLQQLLRDRVVVSLSCKEMRTSAVPGSDRHTDLIFVAEGESLERRFRIVCAILESPMGRKFQNGAHLERALAEKEQGDLSEHLYYARVGRTIVDRAVAEGGATSIPEGVLDAAIEAIKLGEYRHASEEKRQKEVELDAVRSILETLEKQGSVYRARHGDKALVPDRYIRFALADRLPGVLAATDPFVNFHGKSVPTSLSQFTSVFLLLRDRRAVGLAIDSALEVFERTGDSYLLGVLENILGLGLRPEKEIKEFAPPLHLEKLRSALKSAYVRNLPLWRRLWLIITSSELSDQHMSVLRDDRRTEAGRRVGVLSARQEKVGVENAQQEVRRVARERVRAAGRRGADESRESAGPLVQDREALGEVLQLLRAVWDRGELPVGPDVLPRMNADRRVAAAQILELAVVGAASVRPIVAIPVPNGQHVFADGAHLKQNRESLSRSLARRLEGEEEIVIDNVTMTRKREVRDEEAVRAVLNYVRGLS